MCQILDFAQAQSEGVTHNTHIRSIPAKEILFPQELTFPFAVAATESLRLMRPVEVSLPFDAEQQAEECEEEEEPPAPAPPIVPDPPSSSSSPVFRITADRWAAHGSTPGCGGCARLEQGHTSVTHSKACRARFASLLGFEVHTSPVVYANSSVGEKAEKVPPPTGCALPPVLDLKAQ